MSDSEHTLKYDTPIMSYLNLWLLLFSVWFKVTVPTSIINTFEIPRCSKTKQTKKEQLILPEKVIRTEIAESKTLKLRSLSNPSTYSLCILPIRYPIPQPRVLQLLVVIGNNDLLTF